jgi:hypothetical protein
MQSQEQIDDLLGTFFAKSRREVSLLTCVPGSTQPFSMSHPGILLPLFLGDLIIRLSCASFQCIDDSREKSLGLLEAAITALLRSLSGDLHLLRSEAAESRSGFKSLSAVKWIFRLFSFPVIQLCLIRNSNRLITIGEQGVKAMLSFLKVNCSSVFPISLYSCSCFSLTACYRQSLSQ